MFFQPGPAYDLKQGGIDAMLRGLIKQKSESFDACMTSQVVHSLFTNEAPHGPGMDLAVLNIQRARDHGIPCKLYKHTHSLCYKHIYNICMYEYMYMYVYVYVYTLGYIQTGRVNANLTATISPASKVHSHRARRRAGHA